MVAFPALLIGLELLCAETGERRARPDIAALREMLQDHDHERLQSQAALLLVQSAEPEAERTVHEGLRARDEVDRFLALAAAVRTSQATRFADDVVAALLDNRSVIRQAAAEALATLPEPALVKRLQTIAGDQQAEIGVRETCLWVLGRCGRKAAAPVLLRYLSDESDLLRHAAAAALTDLSGQDLGLNAGRWQTWWDRHKSLSSEQWLESRLAYQTSRAHRLEGDLERMRAQTLRLHQQLFVHLPPSEKLAYLHAASEQDDAAVRGLAIAWALEVLPAADPAMLPALAQLLIGLSHDSTPDVQQAAVLALGRFLDEAACRRLEELLKHALPAVRAAAVRSLAAQTRVTGPAASAPDRLHKIVPLLQKALNDPALEVVLEAAEDLGALGAAEAGPVLTGLLHHRAEHVRRTAAQALERVAEPALLDGLLGGLDDPSVTVRFSLVGALGRAAGAGAHLKSDEQERVIKRLETLLNKDADPGIRSRAASVLGECATPAILPVLWRCVLTGEDTRVQEKAFGAFVEILARAGNVQLMLDWDQTLRTARQGDRRVQVLTELAGRWQKEPERKTQAAAAEEALVAALVDQKKWPAAFRLIREALARPASEASDTNQHLQWLLAVGEQALKDGNPSEALKAAQLAEPYLAGNVQLTEAFQKLNKLAAETE